MYSLPADLGTLPRFSSSDLVNFVDKNDARVFHPVQSLAGHLFHINESGFLLHNEVLDGFLDGHLALSFPCPQDTGQQVSDVDVHLLDALTRDDLEGGEATLWNF